MNDFDDVGDFHEKFALPRSPRQRRLYREDSRDGASNPDLQANLYDEALMKFRVDFIKEELAELEEALAEGDLAGVADALIDLEYVTLGFGHVLGLPHDELWKDVQRANMAKQRAAADGSDSKRLSAFDVIKPAGWVGPRGREILASNGFDV